MRMRKVNEYSKSIGLAYIFKNILWEKKKKINFFDGFLYFLKWFINCPKITC